jgi:hypothetical protein
MNRLRPIRAGLLAVAILMGLVIAWRLLFGPFRIFFPVNAPLNPEGFFGLAITLLLLTAVGKPSPHARILTRRKVVLFGSAAVLITLAGLGRALRIHFLSDDFTLMRALAGWDAHRFLRAFIVPTEYLYFRPVGYIFTGLNAAWSSSPVWWHASLLALHACNTVLVLLVARRMGASGLAAAFAAALFGIHGTHPEAAVWFASSFDPVATWFVLAGFLLFAGARDRSGAIRHTLLACAAVCSILAMLSKEAAFIFPLLLLVYAIWRRDSLRSTIPFFLVAALVFAYRWIVLGGIGGYTAIGAGRPMAISLGVDTTSKAVAVRLWSFLYFPINWSVDPSLLLSLLALGYIACLVWLAARTTPSVSLWPALAAMLVSIIPPLALLSGSATLAGSRVLYLPSVWFCVLLALAIDGLTGHWRYLAAAAIVLFHFSALQYNLDSWEYTSAKSKAACDLVARISLTAPKVVVIGKLPGEIRGVQALKNGFPECVEFSAGHPVNIEFLPNWPAAADRDTAYLVWDDATNQLKSIKSPLPGVH